MDRCYSTISEAYHAVPLALLAFSDHSTIFLLPCYRSRLKSGKPTVRTIRRWNAVSGEAVRGCLECTDWQDSGDPRQNIHEYILCGNLAYSLLRGIVCALSPSEGLPKQQAVVLIRSSIQAPTRKPSMMFSELSEAPKSTTGGSWKSSS